MIGRGLGLLIAAAAILLGACAPIDQELPATADLRARPPNIIIILADDLGYGDVGAFGGTLVPTPNIDALARGGVRYTSGYATAAVCAPSRAGLLAGRHQSRFGFEFNPVGRDERTGLPPGETTFAEIARGAGYSTALFGKWHVGQAAGHHPLDQGFEHFVGLLGGATNYFPDGSSGIARAETGADSLTTRTRFPLYRNRGVIDPPGDLTDLLTEESVGFIRARRDRPFLLYLAHLAPHTPLQAAEADAARFAHIASPHQRIYAAMVAKLDASVGRVLGEVRRLGLERDTVVLFLSDNGCPNYVRGACSNAPLSGHKAFPWEGGIRVPFILSAPGRLAGGRIEARPVSSLDILPTIATLAGVAAPVGAEGRSLIGPAPRERTLFWRMGPNFAVREGRWKLLVVNRSDTVDDLTNLLGSPVPDGIRAEVSPLGQWQLLFDLEADPAERNDVAARHPEVVARLRARFAAWNASNVDPTFTSRRQFRAEVNGRRVQLFN
jgi:arylsulfatase A-like enzyme